MGRRAFGRRAVVLLAWAALVLGCVPRAEAFEDWNDAWRADLSDRTGTVASIAVLDAAGPGPALATDGVRLRNVDAATVEVAWLGGTCMDGARFSLARDRGDALDLRYDIGGPCGVTAAAGYALEIRFLHPIDATTIIPIPDWGP